MTKTFVQHFVENLLKVSKVLKTRTALTMKELAEFRYAPYGKALKRSSKQRSKTRLQEKVTNILQNSKIIEIPIDI